MRTGEQLTEVRHIRGPEFLILVIFHDNQLNRCRRVQVHDYQYKGQHDDRVNVDE